MSLNEQPQQRTRRTRSRHNGQSNVLTPASGRTNILRKVRSLEFKGEWIPTTPNSLHMDNKASRFSRTRYHLPTMSETHLRDHFDHCRKPSYSNLLESTLSSDSSHSSNAIHGPPSTPPLPAIEGNQPGTNMMSNVFNQLTTPGTLLNFSLLCALLIATFADMGFRPPKTHRHNRYDDASYYYYDVISTELLHPPHVGSSETKSIHFKKKGHLGSAMIGSLADVLSPILPFAGGVDLRRDENWIGIKNWFNIFGEKIDDTSDVGISNDFSKEEMDVVTSIPRGGAKNDRKQNVRTSTSILSLSATDPFVPLHEISEMTLSDVAVAFQYALESGREGFDRNKFVTKFPKGVTSNDRVLSTLESMDNAIAKSRGVDILPALTAYSDSLYHNNGPLSAQRGYGDVDALQFCAALRILAEWRMLRQVPPGYKQYAVGMNLGHKDIVQNVAKIEQAVHDWIVHRSDQTYLEQKKEEYTEKCRQLDDEDGSAFKSCLNENEVSEEAFKPRSPTLRQLLSYEIEADIHPTSKLPRLKEKTAAMGLLWVRRQLEYQTTLLHNIISVPHIFPDIVSAVGEAYAGVYGSIHGWAVQKIFNYSFQSAPDAKVIFRHMNPKRMREVMLAAMNGDLKSDSSTSVELVNDFPPVEEESNNTSFVSLPSNDHSNESWKDEIIQVQVHDNNKNVFETSISHLLGEFGKFGQYFNEELGKVGNRIGGEWDKLVCGVTRTWTPQDCMNGKSSSIKNIQDTRGGGRKSNTATTDSNNSHIRTSLSGEELEEYISEEMEKDAKQHIVTYLEVAQPLLRDLAGLFEEMNMDDPTKV